MTDIINWKAELKKIEREYDTHGATGAPGRISANGLAATPLSPEEYTNGAMVRIGLSLAVAVGIYFWPYARDCGSGHSGSSARVGVMIRPVAVRWTALPQPRSHPVSIVIVVGLAVSRCRSPRTGYMAISARRRRRTGLPGIRQRHIR